MSYTNFTQGFFYPTHPEKYIGRGKPVYRSSFEFRCCNFFDLNNNVIKWSSESIIIPYKLPNQNKIRRYFVDFYCEIKQNNGDIKKLLIEIKPKKQCSPPVMPKNNSSKSQRRYTKEALTYIINQYKWNAAIDYCKKKGWSFIKLSEDEIFNLKY